jgi:DUF1009 family protein
MVIHKVQLSNLHHEVSVSAVIVALIRALSAVDDALIMMYSHLLLNHD